MIFVPLFITKCHSFQCVVFFFVLEILGGGFVIGSLVSLLFFKRRAFPLWIGTGFGFGVGYRNCETALNSNDKF